MSLSDHIRSTGGEVVHYDETTWVATAVEDGTNRLVKFKSFYFHSGWPVRTPRRGDRIRLRWSKLDGDFLSARLIKNDG